MERPYNRFIYWAPRVLCILFALFISIFALDVFGEGYGFWKTLLALVMHLIPTFLIIIILLIAWRWEWIGTIAFIGLAVFYGLWSRDNFPIGNFLIMGGASMFVGFLFILGWVFHPRKALKDGPNRRKPLVWITLLVILIVIVGMSVLYGSQKPPEITSILVPEDGSQVGFQNGAKGGFTEDLLETDLWLVVQPKDSILYHPQPRLFKQLQRRYWFGAVYAGSPDKVGSGDEYIVYLVAATETASQVFNDYIQENSESQLWPGLPALPEGVTGLDTIQVIRK